MDDKYIGNIPVTNVRLSSGSHRIRVLKELYEAYDASFSISDEQTTMLTPSLVSDFAEITLITTSGADIYVNGEYKGKTSWKGKMASGSYIFETRKQGHISYKMPYDISRNDQGRIIQVQGPAPINGSLVISSVPSEARIYIEGKYVGVAPKYITNQLIGDYDVSVELDGYEKQTKHISVKEGQETNVSFTLKRPFVFDNSSSDGLRVVDSKKFTMYVGESVIAKLSEGTVTKWSIGSSHVNSFYASGERLTARQVGKTSIFGYINGLPKLFEITIVSSKNEAYSSTTSSIEVSPTSSKTLPVQKIKHYSSSSSLLKIGVGDSGMIDFSSSDYAKRPVSWESDNNSIVLVDNDGVIQGVGTGKTSIWAKLRDGDFRMFYIHVEERTSSSSSTRTYTTSSVKQKKSSHRNELQRSNSTNNYMKVGSAIQLYVNSTSVNLWESENGRVATVSSTGEVTAVSEGKTTIWAHMSNGELKMFKINVSAR